MPVDHRIDELISSIVRIAAGDFTQPIAIGAEGDELEAIAVGLNMLAEALDDASVERAALEDQLRRAARAEAVGRLAGGLAHDFNNLLTVISATLSLLRAQNALAPASRDLIENGLDAVEGCAAITRHLLAIGSGRALATEAVDVGRSVTRCVQLLTRTLGELVTFDTSAAPSGHVASVDPSALEQVILNLCLNARDAMPNGGCIRLAVDETDRDGSRFVRLSVSDEGRGIPPEYRTRVFEPFFTTREQSGGTGLGLASVYGIVTQSGGHIDVASPPGCGATFEVYLPGA